MPRARSSFSSAEAFAAAEASLTSPGTEPISYRARYSSCRAFARTPPSARSRRFSRSSQETSRQEFEMRPRALGTDALVPHDRSDLATRESRDFFPRVVARGNARRPHRGRHVVLLPGREAGCGGRVQARGGYVQESGGLLLEEGCRGGSHDAGNDAAEEETTARGRAAGRQRPPGLTRGPHDRPGRPAQRRDASRRCRARGRRSGCPDARRGFAPGGDAIDRRHARERNQPTLAGRAVPGWPDGRPRAARDHDRDARRQ